MIVNISLARVGAGVSFHTDRMVTHNAVKTQLAGTRQVHARATDSTAADHSRLQGITIYYLNTLLRLSTQFHSTRERESETFKMARFEANPGIAPLTPPWYRFGTISILRRFLMIRDP